jgi:hypothetical protein
LAFIAAVLSLFWQHLIAPERPCPLKGETMDAKKRLCACNCGNGAGEFDICELEDIVEALSTVLSPGLLTAYLNWRSVWPYSCLLNKQ